MIMESLAFAFRVFIWMVQIAFAGSTYVNRLLFSSLLMVPGFSFVLGHVFLAVALSAALWALVGWIVVTVNSGTGDEILSWMVIGVGWGIASGMRAYNEWYQELMMRPPAEYREINVVDEPVDIRQPPRQITPDAIDELDDTPVPIE